MYRAPHADERLFRYACAVLLMTALLVVLAAAVVVIHLGSIKPRDEEKSSGLATPAPELVAQALQQPALSIPPDGAIPVQHSPYTFAGNAGRGTIVTYEVQPGENLHDVAARFGLDVCTLLWSNPPELLSQWKAGTPLTILPVDGLLVNIAAPITVDALANESRISVYEIIFSAFNPELLTARPDTILEVGQRVIIPNGQRGDCIPWDRPPWLVNHDGDPLMIGCDYTNPFEGYPTNAPMRDDFRFVRGLSADHAGVDLAAPEGTPVYAAGDGVVRYAGWHPDGLGYVVAIDHGGSHTVYGHLLTINVTCGQPVKARQLIGGVGSTGNSNAPHLHFEVRNGSFDPANPMIFVNKGF
ncbi:MAG: M23 family metallopeptidase [Anaerolineae bacterium]|nr:M23 family metallopeptidase [Anaerolineae bacterium]